MGSFPGTRASPAPEELTACQTQRSESGQSLPVTARPSRLAPGTSKAGARPARPPAAGRSPADVICLAGVLQVQAVGLLPLLVGAHGHDGLPPPLRARDVPAGAEEHPVAVFGRDLVKELSQGLVALASVADFVGHAGGARGDVRRPVLLAGVVQVAGLGGIQAVVPFGDVLDCRRRERGRCEPRAGLPGGSHRLRVTWQCWEPRSTLCCEANDLMSSGQGGSIKECERRQGTAEHELPALS